MIRRSGLQQTVEVPSPSPTIRVGDFELDTEQIVVRKRGKYVG